MFEAANSINFHFISFVVNLLGWTFIGGAMGFFLHKGVRIKQNGSVPIGGLAALIGGSFSAMTHGIFPVVGIDFFNLFVAFLFALVALYIFSPNTRFSIINAGVELAVKIKGLRNFFSVEEKIKFHYFNNRFWRNITSTLSSTWS